MKYCDIGQEPENNNIYQETSRCFSVSFDETMLVANALLRWVEKRGVDYKKILMLKNVQVKAITDDLPFHQNKKSK